MARPLSPKKPHPGPPGEPQWAPRPVPLASYSWSPSLRESPAILKLISAAWILSCHDYLWGWEHVWINSWEKLTRAPSFGLSSFSLPSTVCQSHPSLICKQDPNKLKLFHLRSSTILPEREDYLFKKRNMALKLWHSLVTHWRSLFNDPNRIMSSAKNWDEII